MAYKRLFRSEKDKMIAGVCGGLGQYLDIDPVIIRLIFILIAMAGGGGVIIYLLLWLIVPLEGEVQKEQSTVIAENTKEMKETAKKTAEAVKKALNEKKAGDEENMKD